MKEPAKKLAIVQKPFPYREADKITPRFCCLRVKGGPIVGSLKRQNGWGAKFAIDAGVQGVHAFGIDLMCNIVDKSITLRDGNAVPGDIDTISMVWYTGARTKPDSDEGPYQLEVFEMFCAQDHPEHKAANDSSILEACSSADMRKLTYCRFKSNKTYFTDALAGGTLWMGVDKAILRSLKKLM